MANQHQTKLPKPTAVPAMNHMQTLQCAASTQNLSQTSASNARVIRGPAQRLVSRGSTAPDVQADDKESPEDCIACEVSGIISPGYSYILVARPQKCIQKLAFLWLKEPCCAHLLCSSLKKKRLNFFSRGPPSLPSQPDAIAPICGGMLRLDSFQAKAQNNVQPMAVGKLPMPQPALQLN